VPWIRVIDESEAEGELAQLYEEVRKTRGKVANILKIHSLLPETLQKHLEFYLALMFRPGGLRREQRELIATVVSSLNDCDYCVRHHAEALHFYWRDEVRLKKLLEDHQQAELSPKERAMVGYAAKLTRSPSSVTERDVQALREAGFPDEEILQINLIASYFNFVNRVALGLGVEFSEEEAKGYKYDNWEKGGESVKIAILSDIHDNIWKLSEVLRAIEERGAEALICCGDLCAPFIVPQLAEGFSGAIHIVFGNNDGDTFRIAQQALRYKHLTLHGEFAELTLDGRRFAVTHFPEIGRALARSGLYDVVCYGHDHQFHLSREGDTLLINPGEVMGRFGASTFVVYDTEAHEAERVDVELR